MTRHTYLPSVAITASVILQGDPEAKEHPISAAPISGSFEMNSYRLADGFSLEFETRQLPCHPTEIRSMSIEIYLGERRSIDDPRHSIKTPENLLIVGRVEEPGIRLTESGDTFRCTGKDYTEALSRREWDPSKHVATGSSVVATVQALIDMALDAPGLLKAVYVEGADGPAVRGGVSRIPIVRGDGTKAKGLTYPGDVKIWDVITDVCAQVGKRVFVRGLEVVISTPQDIIDDGTVFDDDGTVEAHRPATYAMAWGKNILDLDLTRRGGGERTPQQIFRCYDPAARKTNEGRFPVVRGEKDPEARAHYVHGVSDPAALAEMAKTAWHEISRGETVLEFETADLDDLNGKSLLQLRAGDAIQVQHDTLFRDELARMGREERIRRLVDNGVDEDTAITFASTFDTLERWNGLYYVRKVVFDWDDDGGGGLSIRVTAVNFIGSRAEKQLQVAA